MTDITFIETDSVRDRIMELCRATGTRIARDWHGELWVIPADAPDPKNVPHSDYPASALI